MRSISSLCFAAGAGLLVALGVAIPSARGDAKPATISVDEIKEGMKGYGLTVFKGYQPERFDVEVIGVLHNFRPAQDLILVKTPNPRLDITKNVQGMSGSPIYLDGRLAGAYAYSLRTFMIEPVAGVTPIAPMLAELHRPIPPGFWPLEGQPPLPAQQAPQRRASNDTTWGSTRWSGAPGEYDLTTHAKQLADRLGPPHVDLGDAARGIVRAGTPLLVGGVTDRAFAQLRALFEPLGLEPLQAGGGAAPATAAQSNGAIPDHFVDGGSLGVQLARGDVSLFGLGTVTHVEGQRLCGFGHPMMNGGDSALPTALGRVLWIYASEQHSFKVGEAIKPLGALVNDRQSAVVVDETKRAPMFPVHIEVKGVAGAPKLVWNMEVAEEKFSSPALAATMFGSVVEATISDHRDMTWTMHSRLAIRGRAPIELDDFGVAIGGLPETGEWFQSRVVRTLGDAINNPWENVHIDGIQATLNVQYARDLWRLRGVDVIDPIIDAGEKARLRLHLRPFSGAEVTRMVDIAIPPELAGRDIEIEVVPGHELVPDVAAPENLDQLLANATRQSYPPKSVVLQIKMPSQGLSFSGHVSPRLPSFALDALRVTTSDVSPEVLSSWVRAVVPTDEYVDGRDKVKIKVRPKLR